MRDIRELYCNTRAKVIEGITKDITNIGKEMDRYQGEAVTTRSAFAYDEANVCRLTSKIEEVSERSKGDGAYWKEYIDRCHIGEVEGPED